MERETKKNKKKVQNRKIFTRFSSPSSSFSKKQFLSPSSPLSLPPSLRASKREKKKKYSRQSLRSPSLIPPLFSISLFLILQETLRNERHRARNGKDGGWKESEEARSEGKEAKGSETRRRRTERA